MSVKEEREGKLPLRRKSNCIETHPHVPQSIALPMAEPQQNVSKGGERRKTTDERSKKNCIEAHLRVPQSIPLPMASGMWTRIAG
jgi:hypothetical protein